jgi:hypothetical protein
LTGPVDRQIIDANLLIGGQLGWLPTFNDRLDDIGAQVGKSKHAREVRGIDAIGGSKV